MKVFGLSTDNGDDVFILVFGALSLAAMAIAIGSGLVLIYVVTHPPVSVSLPLNEWRCTAGRYDNVRHVSAKAIYHRREYVCDRYDRRP